MRYLVRLLLVTLFLFSVTALFAQINPNGGFESAIPGEYGEGRDVPGWFFYKGPGDAVYEIIDVSTDSADVHSGKKALKVTVNAIGSNAWEPQVVNEEFKVESNTTYVITCWAKTDNEGVVVSFTMGSLAPNYHEWGRLHEKPLTTEWQEFTFEVTTRDPESEPRGGIPIHFGSSLNSNQVPFTVYLDDIVVIKKGTLNPNGGFEDAEPKEYGEGRDVRGWFFYNGPGDAVYEIVTDSADVHSGNQALKVTVNAIGSNPWEPQVVNEEYPVESATTYRISFWAKTDNEGVVVSFTMGSLAPNYHEWGRLHEKVLTTEWQEFILEVTTRDPESEPRGGLPIHFGSSLNANLVPFTVYLDDIVVTKVEPSKINEEKIVSERYSLSQNYPNPFNPSTTISFSLPKTTFARLVILNLLGQPVKVVAEGEFTQGEHTIQVNATDLPAGIYLYQLDAGETKLVKKMVLLK